MSLTVGVLGLMWGQILTAIMGFLSFAIGICYAYFVWDRIPFAAANLNTAITAVKVNKGLLAAAGLFLILGMLWSICWSVTTAGGYRPIRRGDFILVFLELLLDTSSYSKCSPCDHCWCCRDMVVLSYRMFLML